LRAVRNRASIPSCGRNDRAGHLSMTAGKIASASCAGVAAACTILSTLRPGPILRRSH